MARERGSTKRNKEAVLVVLGKKAGNVTEACKAAKIRRHTFYAWLKDDPKFAQAVSDVQEGLKDFAESKLHAAIKKGQSWAICFFLKCKAKDRGYIERQELTGADGDHLLSPEAVARQETERIGELMKDPDYRRIHCELIAVADKVAGKNGRDRANGGNGSGGNGSGEPCRPGEAGD